MLGYENLIGKKIVILEIDDICSERYIGREEVVEEVRKDIWGDIQIWGSWGSLALYPKYDKFKVLG